MLVKKIILGRISFLKTNFIYLCFSLKKMSTLFRKIRKKMADDNRPLKYMRYAIGEIVLVVIGILIAIQINNWNEGKKEKLEELDYINSFLQDLENDRLQLESNSEYGMITINGHDSLSRELSKRPLQGSEKKLYHFFNLQNKGIGIPHHDRSITQLKYSGKFRIIGNQDVVDAILDYDTRIINLKNFNEGAYKTNVANNTLIDIAKVFDLNMAFQFAEASLASIDDFKKVNYPAGLRLLSYDDQTISHLRNTLVQGRTLDVFVQQTNDELLQMNKDLQALIRKAYY